MIGWVGARRPSNDRVLAWIGIVLGLIAFWVALPPVKIRTEWIPPVIGLFGITCGVGVLILSLFGLRKRRRQRAEAVTQ